MHTASLNITFQIMDQMQYNTHLLSKAFSRWANMQKIKKLKNTNVFDKLKQVQKNYTTRKSRNACAESF